MAKLNKDQIKYAVQRANDKLNEKIGNLQNSIPEVKDPRYDAEKVYKALYSGEVMSFETFKKKYDNGYYFSNGIRELIEDNVGFMDEYKQHQALLTKLREDIDKQRTAIEDKLYLADDASEVLEMIESL